MLENKFISNIARTTDEPEKKKDRVAWCTTVNTTQKPACIAQTELVQKMLNSQNERTPGVIT
jgi:hypothetical protein